MAMFFEGSNYVLAIFVAGHLITLSAKSFSILTTVFREEDVYKVSYIDT